MPRQRRRPPAPPARDGTFEDINATLAEHPPVDDRLVVEIDVARITPSPRNPREDMGDVGELAESINSFDLLQPVVVRRKDYGYELVAGHRRFAAVKQLERPKIAAVVRDADDDEAYLLTLTENLARLDLSPAEEAEGLARLLRDHGMQQQEIAAAIHKSEAYVSLRLRVFAAEDLRQPVLKQQLSISAAEELLRVRPELRRDLVKQAVREHWTPDQARTARLAARAKTTSTLDSKVSGPEPTPSLASRLRELTDELASVKARSLPASERREVRDEALRLVNALTPLTRLR